MKNRLENQIVVLEQQLAETRILLERTIKELHSHLHGIDHGRFKPIRPSELNDNELEQKVAEIRNMITNKGEV